MASALPAALASGALALLVAACGDTAGPPASAAPEAATPQPVPGISEKAAPTPAVIDTAVPGLKYLRIGMSEEQIRAHDAPMEWSTRSLEGNDYDIVTVTLAPDEKVTGVLDLEQKLYSLEVDTPGITDANGLGLGASLAEVEAAYPQGRLAIGLEEGRYANFLTGGMLVIQFDPADLDDACFGTAPEGCAPSPMMKARKLVLYGTPVT